MLFTRPCSVIVNALDSRSREIGAASTAINLVGLIPTQRGISVSLYHEQRNKYRIDITDRTMKGTSSVKTNQPVTVESFRSGPYHCGSVAPDQSYTQSHYRVSR